MIEYKEVNSWERDDEGYEKVVLSTGAIWYQLDGKWHREDGPAIIWQNGDKEYYLDGIYITPSNHHLFTPLQLAKLGLI